MTKPAPGPTVGQTPIVPSDVRLTELAHGGGCGCKIAPDVLARLLHGTLPQGLSSALMVGVETSDDAAVYRLNDQQALIATTDFFMPIVDDPFDFGRIAATNALSDVYAMGGQPIMALSLVGMPIAKLAETTIRRILEGGAAVCQAAGIPLAGGHTIDSMEPIYGLVALGLGHPERIKRNSGARPGDRLILGKPLGVGILAAAHKQGKLSQTGYNELIATTTALNRVGSQLAEIEAVHALTDVTGFGLAGHLLEMVGASKVRAELDFVSLPFLAEARPHAAAGMATGASSRNDKAYGAALTGQLLPWQRTLLTDPQTSGGLLAAVAPADAERVLALFHASGQLGACSIGTIAAGEPHIAVTGGGAAP